MEGTVEMVGLEGTVVMVGKKETVEMVGLVGTVEMVGTANAHQRAMKEGMGVDRQLTVGMVVLEVFQGILEDRPEVKMEATLSEAGNLIKKDQE